MSDGYVTTLRRSRRNRPAYKPVVKDLGRKHLDKRQVVTGRKTSFGNLCETRAKALNRLGVKNPRFVKRLRVQVMLHHAVRILNENTDFGRPKGKLGPFQNLLRKIRAECFTQQIIARSWGQLNLHGMALYRRS